ncbi:MAG TPA: GAF domain-containing protein [Polyangiaceae bacterium]|nr:GAF domain-containing protein [Polyangiaceae bacterium]
MTTNAAENSLHDWLIGFLTRFGATSGTIHLRTSDSDLQLAASHNIPPQVLQVVREIPLGKGMAGLAWQRNEPVSTCNLQTDSSGDVRPGAKAVQAQAAVALPIHHADEVMGVVGIAFAEQRSLSEQELAHMAALAESVPRPG